MGRGTFRYIIPGIEETDEFALDIVTEYGRPLVDFRKRLLDKYEGKISCAVSLRTLLTEGFYVKIESREEGLFEGAVRELFFSAGIPYFIEDPASYGIINKVLEGEGKIAKRRLNCLFQGRFVCDLEEVLSLQKF